jgi:hypothetical protein
VPVSASFMASISVELLRGCGCKSWLSLTRAVEKEIIELSTSSSGLLSERG